MLDRFIDGAERLAGAFLAFVTALTFISVALRYIFSWAIPDSYDLSRYFLAILIFWGIAASGYRGTHITVDLLWGTLGAAARRGLEAFANLLTFVAMAAFCWAMGLKVLDAYGSGEATYDLGLPVWPFFLVAWLGTLAAALLLLVRVVRQRVGPAASGAAPAHH